MNHLSQALIDACQPQPHNLLLQCGDKQLSRSDFLKRVIVRKNTISEQMAPGNVVLNSTGRGIDYWVDMVALWANDCVMVPIDAAIESKQLQIIIDKSQANFLISADGIITQYNSSILDIDACSILFTSGTTGEPKGVMLSDTALLSNVTSVLKRIKFNQKDKLFINTPFHFTSAICHFLASVLSGGCLVCEEEKKLFADLHRALKASHCNAFAGAPIQIAWLLECAAFEPLAVDWLMSSGDHLPVQSIEKCQNYYPDATLYAFYGLTELGGRLCAKPIAADSTYITGVGVPIDGFEVCIRNTNGECVGDGEIGEVYATGPGLFTGYVNDPEVTNESLTNFGFKTGDMGYWNESGSLILSGRSDQVFKCAGQKVSCYQVEEALMKVGNFKEVCVVPVTDKQLGQLPAAVVVPENSAVLDQKLLLPLLKKLLPSHMVPRHFQTVEALPRKQSGKLDRKRLVALFA